MREFVTRRERHHEKLDAFLKDDSIEVITLYLYNRELKKIPAVFPSVSLEKKDPYKGDLWVCEIRKNK